MTRQVSLEFGDGVRAAEAWTALRDALDELIDVVSLKEAAFRLGLDPSTLHKKLADKDRHHLSARELVLLLVSVTASQSKSVLVPLAAACGCDVVEAEPLTPEQTLERVLSAAREEYGPSFDKVLKRATGGRR